VANGSRKPGDFSCSCSHYNFIFTADCADNTDEQKMETGEKRKAKSGKAETTRAGGRSLRYVFQRRPHFFRFVLSWGDLIMKHLRGKTYGNVLVLRYFQWNRFL
jgi:hypothetical protein